MPGAQAAIGGMILRRNGYGSWLGLNRRGQRVRTMPALTISTFSYAQHSRCSICCASSLP
jgi:hypothetical protein